jgi:hypothetical protein
VLDHPIAKSLEPSVVSVYVRELYNLAVGIRRKCETIFEKTPPIPVRPDRYISSAPEIHDLIHGVLVGAASVKRMIVTPSTKLKGETKRQFDLRRYRAALLNAALHPTELKEMLDQKVRNSLEHFDEYMDSAVLELSDATRRPSPWAAFNLIISGRDVFQPNIYPIKLYIAEEKVFCNMKWSINLSHLHQEAVALEAALKKHESIADQEGPGGMLFTFRGSPSVG